MQDNPFVPKPIVIPQALNIRIIDEGDAENGGNQEGGDPQTLRLSDASSQQDEQNLDQARFEEEKEQDIEEGGNGEDIFELPSFGGVGLAHALDNIDLEPSESGPNFIDPYAEIEVASEDKKRSSNQNGLKNSRDHLISIPTWSLTPVSQNMNMLPSILTVMMRSGLDTKERNHYSKTISLSTFWLACECEFECLTSAKSVRTSATPARLSKSKSSASWLSLTKYWEALKTPQDSQYDPMTRNYTASKNLRKSKNALLEKTSKRNSKPPQPKTKIHLLISRPPRSFYLNLSRKLISLQYPISINHISRRGSLDHADNRANKHGKKPSQNQILARSKSPLRRLRSLVASIPKKGVSTIFNKDTDRGRSNTPAKIEYFKNEPLSSTTVIQFSIIEDVIQPPNQQAAIEDINANSQLVGHGVYGAPSRYFGEDEEIDEKEAMKSYYKRRLRK
ncbi:uncharacterized protein DFL_008052 [Arthrobotrys flagrans]|uniref:Uncharacterized protein n=1 Tax=Arthrobotrys flagrans TaxID=97331 RepID=A0A436ZMQ3_ARTFL|nr:hypothetical protein DFL_008052 [Arthrobotrys flagrans]